MKIKFKLNSKLRRELSKPLGKVFSEENLLIFLRGKWRRKKIIVVGDQTGRFLSANKIEPWLWIYDGKIKRRKIRYSLPFPTHIVENPRSVITDELCNTLDDIFQVNKNNENKFRVYVIGEEDLATLYVLYKAKNSLVLYGQPNKGIVAIEANDKMRRKASLILKEMLKEKEKTRKIKKN